MPYGEILFNENNEPVYETGSYTLPDENGSSAMRLSVSMEISEPGDIGEATDVAFQDILDRLNASPYFQQPFIGIKRIPARRLITPTPSE